MKRERYLFRTILLAAGLLAVVAVLVPATRNARAQLASTPCIELRDRVEANERKVVKYENYVDIKINPDVWRDKLAKLDRTIAEGNVLNDANAICRSLSCTAIDQGTDLESRKRFLKDVRDILARAIDEVLKTDAAKLAEDLASAKKDLSVARDDLRNKHCENIQVLSATYGGNCEAPLGNVTNFLMKECDGKEFCSYRIDYTVLSDPAPRCAKDYVATWRCGFDGPVLMVTAAAEAGTGSNVTLSCDK